MCVYIHDKTHPCVPGDGKQHQSMVTSGVVIHDRFGFPWDDQ